MIMRSRMFLFHIFTMLVISTSVYSETLREIVWEALETNPQMIGRNYGYQAQRQLVRRANSRFLPRIDVLGDTGPEHVNNSATRQAFGGAAKFRREDATLVAGQTIFDGGERWGSLQQERSLLMLSQSEWREVAEFVAFSSANAFVNVLRTREIVKIYSEDVESHEVMLKKIIKRTEAGAGRKSDIQLTKSRLALARSRLLEAEANLRQANYEFEQFVGRLPPEELILPDLPCDIPENYEMAEAIATASNPSLSVRESEAAAAHAQIDIDRATLMPNIGFELTAFHGRDLNGVPGKNIIVNGLITLEWNWFNGWGDLALIRSSRAAFTESLYNYEDTRRIVYDEVATAFDFFVIDQERLVDLQEHKSESHEVFLSYIKEFEVGHRSLFDLLNAEIEYYQARVSETDGFYNQFSDAYRLLSSMGQLANHFEIVRDQFSCCN